MTDKSESFIQDMIRCNAPALGCLLMRNNSGVLKDVNGRPIRYGLMNDSKILNDQIKSSDLIGFTRVTITPEMIGRTLAVFTAVEVKAGDWKPSATCKREKAQRAFVDWIVANGGIAGMVNSWQDFEVMINK